MTRPSTWRSLVLLLALSAGAVLAHGRAGAAADPTPPAPEPSPASADSALTLLDAVQRSLATYPSIAATRASRDEARAASKEAAAAFFPTLGIRSDATRYEEPTLVSPIHGFTPSTIPPFSRTVVQSSLSANLMLLDGGARLNRYKSARETARATEASLDAAQQTLVAQAVAVYLAVLGNRDLLDAHDRRLEALRAERSRVQSLLDAGKAARVDLLRVEAEVASAEADRVKASAALDDAERQLGRLTGLDAGRTKADRLAPVALIDSTLTPRDAWMETALAKSPAMQEAKQRRLAADAARRAAQGARFPEVSAVGAYTDWRDLDGEDALEWSAGLRLSLPIFTGGAVTQRIAKARAAADGTAARARLAEIETRREVDRAYSAVEAARARVESLERAVARFAEVARIEDLQLRSGAGTQTDYLKSESDLLSARAGWIDARNGEIVARAELARVAGVLDLNWLTSRLERTR